MSRTETFMLITECNFADARLFRFYKIQTRQRICGGEKDAHTNGLFRPAQTLLNHFMNLKSDTTIKDLNKSTEFQLEVLKTLTKFMIN